MTPDRYQRVVEIFQAVSDRKLADSHGHSVGAAGYYAATGEVDAMFEALYGAYRQRDVNLLLIQIVPFFDPYRTDPRFQALLRKMNLAENVQQ